jgi:hypothetical protein
MPRQPEGKLVAKIKDFLVDEGARPFKIVGSDEGFQEIGIPDLLVCYKGWFIGAEVKQSGGKLRPAQRVILHEIYRAGGVAAVLETVEQTERLLLTIKERRPSESPLCYDRGELRTDRCSFR